MEESNERLRERERVKKEKIERKEGREGKEKKVLDELKSHI
jgi:hypothetical protein